MFDRLANIVEKDTQTYLDRDSDVQDYAGRLGYFGNQLVANLHGHHTWEDRSYFPELNKTDPRLKTDCRCWKRITSAGCWARSPDKTCKSRDSTHHDRPKPSEG
ncbi:MAG: hemerythrin domain-containing protein [Amylibacter sp.]